MPNNFGGDQMDPDYAPHLYDNTGKLAGDADDESNVRRVPRNPPTPTDPPTTAPTDRRVRSVVGDYRAVIPDGTQKGRRFFVNNSPVVIEKRSKDATGAEKWDRVTSFPKLGPHGSSEDADHAIYWLLAGPDAE